MKKVAVVGAGLSGAIVAHELAKTGVLVDVFEKRNHIGGNCYTERDEATGIIEHKYGPHIFHTADEEVWDYVTSFVEMVPFTNRVKTTVGDSVYSMPINLHTINQFYGRSMSPIEAREFMEAKRVKIEPSNFEEQALYFVGEEMYGAFFRGYTEKQWGVDPSKLPASILKRLPMRFNYDDNYFDHKYQGMPRNGYTELFEKLLDIDGISLYLNSNTKQFDRRYDHIFYTGPIDAWFDYKYGKLGYRSLDFVKEQHEGDYQGCAVMNYPDREIPYTRITEHKHFSPWEECKKTIIYKEYSKACDDNSEPFYPIRLEEDKRKLALYASEVNATEKITFLGRLATYKYIDMDVTIRQALDVIKVILKGGTPPKVGAPLL